MVETGKGGVCYQNGEVVRHNHQICKVTNKKITDLLGEQRPEVTFTCQKEQRTCDFQCVYQACLFDSFGSKFRY